MTSVGHCFDALMRHPRSAARMSKPASYLRLNMVSAARSMPVDRTFSMPLRVSGVINLPFPYSQSGSSPRSLRIEMANIRHENRNSGPGRGGSQERARAKAAAEPRGRQEGKARGKPTFAPQHGAQARALAEEITRGIKLLVDQQKSSCDWEFPKFANWYRSRTAEGWEFCRLRL